MTLDLGNWKSGMMG